MPTKEATKAVAEMLADIPDGGDDRTAFEQTALTVDNLADAVATEAPPATAPAADTPPPADPPTTTPAAPAAEPVDEGMVAFATRAKELYEQGGMAAVLEQLYREAAGDDQRAFIDNLTKDVSAKAPKVNVPDTYEPQSALESALMPVKDEILALPQLKQDIRGAFGAHADIINEARLYNEVHNVQLKAVLEALGVAFDKPDIGAMKKAVARDGDYAAAVAKGYNVKKTAEAIKQALKPRPATPGAGANDAVEAFKPGTSMVEMLKRERANGRL